MKLVQLVSVHFFNRPIRLKMMFVFSDIDECASSPCENDATCEDGVNSYTCKCKAGFAGKNCEESKCW